jgi:hypothetical protein
MTQIHKHAVSISDGKLGYSIDTIKKNTESLLEDNKDLGLEINAEKTMYMIISCHPYSV